MLEYQPVHCCHSPAGNAPVRPPAFETVPMEDSVVPATLRRLPPRIKPHAGNPPAPDDYYEKRFLLFTNNVNNIQTKVL